MGMPYAIAVMVCFAAVAVAAADADVTADPVNPFSRPARAEATNVSSAQVEVLERPVLRGVIAAGRDSIANLSGALLAIGEEDGGYLLESVTETSATFLHEGKRVVFSLEEPPADEDADRRPYREAAR